MMDRTRRQFLKTAVGAALGSAAGGSSMADQITAPPVIDSKFVDSDSTPDGDLGKSMWSAQEPVWFDQAAFSDGHYPDFKSQRRELLECAFSLSCVLVPISNAHGVPG